MNSFNSPVLDAIGGLKMKNYCDFCSKIFQKEGC